ncbi:MULTISPECIES: GNAT family N-acetyltransferase [unclassified Aureimonas]|uniref:GNAT family N-acetyltransferase n=1 Tax=unclassified Aureimonas TaxID=2615206 RepID=UPI0006FB5988|nr:MULTISPECIES: GNAT family N-acetyltransferase [unclassified Aureimonas]KQT64403.1 hypothetical protein ASG62_05400 [Aureimonas sp. Leaf427]KQT81593.1 hypothetical protein ASG54_02680 [Aureimonas sp. Leaf460]
MHLAPDGFRIRLMEPGEAEGLRGLGAASGLFAGAAPDMPDFVRWLLLHEIFVAETGTKTEAGRLAGFAAARDATDLYWLSGLAVDPAFRGRGVRKALLAAVVARAGWFFHRAVGLAVQGEAGADWYRRRRFLGVDRKDWTQELARLAGEVPGLPPQRFDGDDEALGAGLVGTERNVMIHWL